MMRIVRGISHWKYTYEKPVLAIGVFDGLHHGHRRLIEKMMQRVDVIGGTPVVMTFDPHPAKRLHPERNIPLIASLDYRLKLLEDAGVRACLVTHFTKRFSQMRPSWFIEQYLMKKLNVAEVVVGEDFRFGYRRSGDVRLLKNIGNQNGFKVHEISVRRSHGQKRVSSTLIRQYLANADISHAQKLLDRPVTIMGRVIKGDQRGRSLGYRTANLDSQLTGFAPRGVYCVRIHVGEKSLCGIANIGSRPSFKKDASSNIEVHIFDFDQNLYGRNILVEFLKKIRDEKIFSSPSELVEQIHLDEFFARSWFSTHI